MDSQIAWHDPLIDECDRILLPPDGSGVSRQNNMDVTLRILTFRLLSGIFIPLNLLLQGDMRINRTERVEFTFEDSTRE